MRYSKILKNSSELPVSISLAYEGRILKQLKINMRFVTFLLKVPVEIMLLD